MTAIRRPIGVPQSTDDFAGTVVRNSHPKSAGQFPDGIGSEFVDPSLQTFDKVSRTLIWGRDLHPANMLGSHQIQPNLSLRLLPVRMEKEFSLGGYLLPLSDVSGDSVSMICVLYKAEFVNGNTNPPVLSLVAGSQSKTKTEAIDDAFVIEVKTSDPLAVEAGAYYIGITFDGGAKGPKFYSTLNVLIEERETLVPIPSLSAFPQSINYGATQLASLESVAAAVVSQQGIQLLQ